MKKQLLAFILGVLIVLTIAATPFWSDFVNRYPDAATSRIGLGITNGYGLFAGTNIVFSTSPKGLLQINATVTGLPGSGTVTSFSSGNLSPLFTTIVANPATTPSLTFSAIAQNANLIFAGPSSGVPASPDFRSLVASDIPSLSYVTSVGLSAPAIFSVGGSPVTSSGTLALSLATESDRTFFVGPTSGGPLAPTFRTVGIDELSDVTISSPAAGDIIAWSGSTFTNGPPQSGTNSGNSSTLGLMDEQTNTVITLRTIAPDVADGTVSTFNGFGDTIVFANSGGAGAGLTKNYLTGSVVGSYAEMRTSATSGAIEVLSTSAAINAMIPYAGGAYYWQSYCVLMNTNSVRVMMGGWASASGFDPFASDGQTTPQIVFRYSTAASDLTWKAICSDGTNTSIIDTGVAVQTNTAYFFQIRKTGTPAITFTVNRTTSVSTNGATAGIPNSNNPSLDKMFVFSGMKTLATGAKTNLIRYLGYTVDWPAK